MMKAHFIRLVTFCLLFTVVHTGIAQVAAPLLKDKFGKRNGNLRFSSITLAFGKIKSNEVRTDTLHLFNAGERSMTLSLGSKIPGHLQVVLGQASLEPNAEGWMAVTFDAARKNDFGFVFDRFLLLTNDSIQPSKALNVSATISEYFPVMSAEDSSTVQKSRVSEMYFDYGRIHQGDKASHNFVIYNDGKRDLQIHKVKSNCGCIRSTISKSVVPPSDSSVVQIEFDSFGKEGKDSRKVNVYLNDPAQPELKLEIKGEVFK